MRRSSSSNVVHTGRSHRVADRGWRQLSLAERGLPPGQCARSGGSPGRSTIGEPTRTRRHEHRSTRIRPEQPLSTTPSQLAPAARVPRTRAVPVRLCRETESSLTANSFFDRSIAFLCPGARNPFTRWNRASHGDEVGRTSNAGHRIATVVGNLEDYLVAFVKTETPADLDGDGDLALGRDRSALLHVLNSSIP